MKNRCNVMAMNAALALSLFHWYPMSSKVGLSRPRVQVRPRTLPYVVRFSYLKPQSPLTRELFGGMLPEVMCRSL